MNCLGFLGNLHALFELLVSGLELPSCNSAMKAEGDPYSEDEFREQDSVELNRPGSSRHSEALN